MTRNTTLRDKHRHIIKEGLPPSPYGPHPDCYHCGQPIDYEAHHHNPHSFQIDHINPIAAGGTDTLDNICPSHRACNRTKSAKTDWRPGVTYINQRRWTKPPKR